MGIKTKLGLAVATTAVGAAMIGGGTYALFSAESSNAGNTFSSATVAISGPTSPAAGLDTCWFNPKRKPNHTEIVPTYQIQKLEELYRILDVEI